MQLISNKMKKLLIIGFVWPEPKSSAAGNRMMQLINLFQNLNYEITFVSTALNIEFSEDLSVLNIKTQQIFLNDASFDLFCTNLSPDMVLFDRFLTEEQFGWRISENCPNAIKILDTTDLHSLRLTRQKAIKENIVFSIHKLLQSEIAKREIASIYRCDLSLFVSEFEIDLLKDHFSVPDYLLYYLPIFVEDVNTDTAFFEDRSDFVFIGNFLHEPNFDAVKYLSDSIWNKIHKQLPDAKMLVYGAYPMQKAMQLNQPNNNFFICGRADSAEKVIKNAKVLLAPIRFGAGIKGKLLEAMQLGTPTVTSTIGAEGMHKNLLWNGFITDEIETFVEKAITLYSDKNIWKTSQQNGYILLENCFLKSNFESNFNSKIFNVETNFKEIRLKNFTGSMLSHHLNNSTKFMSKWIEEKNKKSSFKND